MTSRPPDVLLILQDQLRYDVAVTSAWCETPALDALREAGTTLTAHYTPLGICSPARASLFTGRYPHSHGVLNNMGSTDALARNLPRDVPTAAELLGKLGYRTGYVGKWHLGLDDGAADRGFADSLTPDRVLMMDERFTPYWRRFRDHTADAVFTPYPTPGPRHASRFARVPFPMYSTEAVPEEITPARAVADSAIALLRDYADRDEPFFLVASFLEPHWPHVLPEPYASRYDPATVEPWPNFADDFSGKPRTNAAGIEHFGVADLTWDDWREAVARYFGSVSFIDDLTGRVVAALDESGRGGNTVVLVTADHGDLAGAHRQFNKGPLMYEEVYHVPFVARWPGTVPAGATVGELTSHVDVLPTLLDAAGGDTPGDVQGSSLLPLLRGEPVAWRDALMCEFHGDEFGLYSQRMIRRDEYKLVYNPNDVRELYDLAADPYEMRNLAYEPGYADLRRDLEAHLLELMHDTEDPLRQWAVNTLG